jgi:hypothetical protein
LLLRDEVEGLRGEDTFTFETTLEEDCVDNIGGDGNGVELPEETGEPFGLAEEPFFDFDFDFSVVTIVVVGDR